MKRVWLRRSSVLVAIGAFSLIGLGTALAQQGGQTASGSANKQAITADGTTATGQEIAELKAILASQQRQIEELRATLEKQQKLIEGVSQPVSGGTSETPAPVAPPAGVRKLGEVASTTPMVPSGPKPEPLPASQDAPQTETAGKISPLQFHIGSAYITPVGFMDFTIVGRSTNPGSGIGTNFGSIPYGNTTSGKLTDLRFSAQNSRIGLRVDAKVKGAYVLGYLESDFLGFVPTNAAVSSNSDGLRLRLYWVDVRKDKVEFFGGQSWSMLTPNRRGLSALPGDLSYTQNIDVNYQLGLTWSRNPQLRFIVHPSAAVAWGVSLEEPEQYIGGSAGGGVVTLPSSLTTPYANQLNDGTRTLSVPAVMPDIISKIAFDPRTASGRAVHFEIAGVVREFRVYNPANTNHYSATGAGGSANLNFELVKNLRLFTNNYFSDGGGRWIFGQAPDLVVRGDGSLSPLHASSTLDGFEAAIHNTQLSAYYGGVWIGRATIIDPATGKPVGYGYSGSPGGQNRDIHEITFNLNQTFWKDPKYGALNLMLQYSYLFRYPWFIAAGAPGSAHASMAFLNLRYTLPGSAPTIE
jgi:hypothetical protein